MAKKEAEKVNENSDLQQLVPDASRSSCRAFHDIEDGANNNVDRKSTDVIPYSSRGARKGVQKIGCKQSSNGRSPPKSKISRVRRAGILDNDIAELPSSPVELIDGYESSVNTVFQPLPVHSESSVLRESNAGDGFSFIHMDFCKHDEFDADDENDILACHEYVHNIFTMNKDLEERHSPTVYMHLQVDINIKMRAILIDWIVDVHNKFKLCPATLHLTCNILDRFLIIQQVARTELQLVGVAALLIACKYEEIYPPEVNDCVFLADYAYERAEIIAMEMRILSKLRFEITVPTTWCFMTRLLKITKSTELQIQRASYYSERCLQEHDMLSFRPSLIASTAVWLSHLFDKLPTDAWPDSVRRYTNLDTEMMSPCARMMIQHLGVETVTTSSRHLRAVKKKYSSLKFLAVASEGFPLIPQETFYKEFADVS